MEFLTCEGRIHLTLASLSKGDPPVADDLHPVSGPSTKHALKGGHIRDEAVTPKSQSDSCGTGQYRPPASVLAEARFVWNVRLPPGSTSRFGSPCARKGERRHHSIDGWLAEGPRALARLRGADHKKGSRNTDGLTASRAPPLLKRGT